MATSSVGGGSRVEIWIQRSRCTSRVPIRGPVETADAPNSAPLSIAALLERAVAMGASDLHVTAGSFPAVRRHGHIELLDDCPMLDPDMIRQLIYRITTTEQ